MTDFIDPWAPKKPTQPTASSETGGFVDPWENKRPSRLQTQSADTPKPSGLLRRTLGDTAVDLGRGIIGVGEAAVGLANIPTFGYAGKGLEAIGYDPKTTKEMIGELHSPERKAALAEVDQAEGFTGTAKAMLRNPSTIAGAVAESAPSILGGGAIARGLGAVGKLSRPVRAAIGEGAVGAGGAAEGIRQETEDGTLTGKQVAAALGTGATTALLGYGGGRLAQRLGIGDVDTVLAGAGANGIRRPVPTPGLVRRTLQGAATEGVLEEMPQSVTEQMWQNLALDRPLAEGVPESAAAGMLTGTAIGGPFAALSRPRPTVEPAPDIPDDITGARARALERMTPQQREEMVASDAAPAARPEGNLTDTLRQQQEGQFLADIEAAETPADRAAAEARLAEFRQQVAAFDGEVADGNVVGGSAAPVETTGVGDATAGEAVPGGDPQRDGAGAAVPEGSVPGVQTDLAGAGSAADTQPALSPGQLFPRAAPRLPDGSPVPDPAAGPLSRAVNGGVATGAIPTARTLIPFPGAAPSTASDAVNALAATQPVLSGLARPEPGSAPGTNISRPASELNAVDDAPSEPAGDDGEIVMQNRDRSRVASVGQMRSIRNNPDAERLGFSRDPNTGAPMVGEGRAVPDADKGASDVVVGSDGKRVPVRYAVVEASELAASHDADGRVNPRYAQAPLKALNNGRVAGLQAAWLSGTAQDYRAGIIADARTHGVPEAAISSKKSPVLVRLYDPSTNMGDMGAWSNASAQLGMSPVEQAQTDARSLPPLDSITWSQDGNLIPAANANFFRAWFGNLGGAEAASLQDADGKANALALRRVQAAIVQRAYGDERVLTALAEEVDPDNRNIINALVRAAPSFAALGTNDPLATDIRQRVIEALETVRHADQQGVPLEAALAQADMLGRAPEADAIAQFMGGNKRSVRRMADAFTAMTKYVTTAQSQAATTDIFGDRPKPTIHAALEAANQTLRENYGDQYRIELPSQSDLGIAQPGDRSSEREGWERAASDQAATTETVPDEPGVERPQDQPETLTLATQLGEPDLGQSPPAASQEGLFAPPTRREELEAFDTLFDTIESRTDPETGGVMLFSRENQSAGPVENPLSVQEVENAIAGIRLSSRAGLARNGVEVVVVPDYSRFPPNADGKPHSFTAGYIPETNTIAIVAMRIGSPESARKALLHEMVGHFGLNLFPPKVKQRILEAINRTRDGKVLAGVWNEVKQLYADKGQIEQAEEVFARIAEDTPSGMRLWWDRFLSKWVLPALRALGLTGDTITRTDLRVLAADIAQGIREGAAQRTNADGSMMEQRVFDGSSGDIRFSRQDAKQAGKPYETDLFGNHVPAPARKTARTRPKSQELHGDVQPASDVQDTQAPKGEYHVRTIVGHEVTRKLGANRILTADDAAKATQYLYRSAVERFDAIVTDKDGKPLAVVGGFKGALDQAAVYAGPIMAEAIRVPGAANIWFSHNHPSGKSELSAADKRLNATLSNVFNGSGIQPRGLLAVSGDGASFIDERQDYLGRSPIAPADTEATLVPVIEREQLPSTAEKQVIGSPTDAKNLASAYAKEGGDGILLLNAQHEVVAWVPITDVMRGTLRNTGGLAAIYRAISESNAGAAILVHDGSLDALHPDSSAVTVGNNIAAALANVEVRPLDSINVKTSKSLAETGAGIAIGPVYSKREPGPAFLTRATDVQAAVLRVLDTWKGDKPVVRVVQSMAEARKQGAKLPADAPSDVEGWWDGDSTVWVVAGNNRDVARALETLSHEAIGHYGIERIMEGKDWTRLVADVKRLRGLKQSDVSPKIWKALQSAERRYGNESAETFAKEFLAIMAEQGIRSGLTMRVVAKIRQFLAKLGIPMNISKAFREAELLDALYRGRKRVTQAPRGEAASTGRPAWEMAFSQSTPTFYSAMLDAVSKAQGVPKKGGDAAFWKGWMDGAIRRGEMKQAERDWLGVDAWLDGRDSTTRAEIADFIRANEVQVEDVVLGRDVLPAGAETPLTVDQIEIIEDPEDSEFWVADSPAGNRLVGKKHYPTKEAAADFALRYFNGHINERNRERAAKAGVTPKYESYQLPGGENYRELLLTLPPRESTPESLPVVQGEDGRYRVRTPTSNGRTTLDYPMAGYDTRAEAEEHAARSGAKRGDKAVNYQSSHFDQPNILSHVRFNERTDADGNRVLFIEEIQSDFGQSMRKSKLEIVRQVKYDFDGIVNRMKAAGVLTVECD